MRGLSTIPRSIVPPSASTACSTCSTQSPAKATPTAIPRTTSRRPARTPTRSSWRSRASADSELSLTQKENELLVSGQTAPNGESEKQFLYRGIAGRNFERRFQLADHVKVTGAKLANGLLTIELQREIPEEKKARAIEIMAEAAKPALTH